MKRALLVWGITLSLLFAFHNVMSPAVATEEIAASAVSERGTEGCCAARSDSNIVRAEATQRPVVVDDVSEVGRKEEGRRYNWRSLLFLIIFCLTVFFVAFYKVLKDFFLFLREACRNEGWKVVFAYLGYFFMACIFRLLNRNRFKPDSWENEAPGMCKRIRKFFFELYEGDDELQAKDRKGWLSIRHSNNYSAIFRRVYNIWFRNLGRELLDSVSLRLSMGSGWWLLGVALFVILAITIGTEFLFGLFEIFLMSPWNGDFRVLNAFAALWNEANVEQINVLFLFFHWFMLLVVTSILLAFITRRAVNRRPHLILPQRAVFDPNQHSLIFWLGNNDSSLLVDFSYKLEFTITFVDSKLSARFRGKQNITNISSFQAEFPSPASSLEERMGLIVATSKIMPGEATPLTIDVAKARKPVPISIESMVCDQDGNELFPLFEPFGSATNDATDETPKIKRLIRLFIYATEVNTGRRYIFTEVYDQDKIVCGSNASLAPRGDSSLGSDWTLWNRLNWTRVLPLDSDDYKVRIDADKRRRENNAQRERIKVWEKGGDDKAAQAAYDKYMEEIKAKAEKARKEAEEKGEDGQKAYEEVYNPRNLPVTCCDDCPYREKCPRRGRYQ